MPAPQTEVIITVKGTERGRHVFVPGDYIIGRDEDCHIHVDADTVSGTHAKLILNYDHALIEDLGSSGGTKVNGHPIPKDGTTRLWPNQKIQLGTATIELRRLKHEVSDLSLAPTQAVVRRVLPEDLLREKKYDIGKVVARGGMGAILDAKESAIERTVAMKVMLDSNSPDDLLRFLNEAKVTGQLEHPNIVPIHELSVDENGQPFYTMKMMGGLTLKKVLDLMAAGDAPTLEKHPLPALLTVFQKICDAIAFAHSKGVLHRDLKPENIMLGDYGEAVVMDWGLAKRMRNAERGARKDEGVPAEEDIHTIRHTVAQEMPASPELDPATLASTMTGTIMGTPQFMSPEQARGEVETLDARSDIYSLGAILYQILSLRVPVTGTDAMDVVGKVGRGEIEPLIAQGDVTPRRKDAKQDKGNDPKTSPFAPSRLGVTHLPSGRIPESLAAVVRKAMALDPEARYASTTELQADILAYQNGFATSAEHAGVGKQLVLLIRRNKGIFSTAAAAWLLITALAVWFVINLRIKERRAVAGEQSAIASEGVAKAEAERATKAEAVAVAEKENVRRALAESALALAEAAYREANGPAMQAALDRVPSDLRDASWSYLLEQSDMSIARIPYGGYSFRSVAAHPKLPGVFAVAGDKPMVAIFDARTGKRLSEFPVALNARAGSSLRIAFSPDGERIAFGLSGADAEETGIKIHNAQDGSELAGWKTPGVGELDYSPDGRHLLQYSRAGKGRTQSLILWNANDGRQEWSYQKPGAFGNLRGRFTPDGRQVVAASTGNNPVVLDVADGATARDLGVRIAILDMLAIHPNGSALLWGDARGYVHCCDLNDGHLLFSTHLHAAGVKQIALTRDGDRFVSIAELRDGRQSIVISDARTGTPIQSLLGGGGSASAIAIHPLSGELLVVGGESRVWDISAALPRWPLDTKRSDSVLGGAVFLMTDDFFLGPSPPSRVALLDLRDGSVPWRPAKETVGRPCVSADGKIVALLRAGEAKNFVQIMRREDTTLSLLRDFPITGDVRTMRLSAAGDRVLSVPKGPKYAPTVHDAATGEEQVALERNSLPEINDAQWIGGGRQILGVATANKARGIGNTQERIVLWDAASGKQVRSVVHSTALDCLVVSPDGKSFAAAGADKLVHVFDTETLAERQAFRAHDGPITALAWHPARPIVATASEDLTIKLWNLDTGRRLETLRGPTDTPRMLNFSPSGQRLACASLDRTVRIWEPPSLNNATLDAPKTDGWEDLLAKLKADDVKANGNGWTLSGGVLISPEKPYAALPLAGNYARSSYQVHVTLRSLKPQNFLGVILPIADQQVAFFLDGYPKEGFVTGLWLVDGKMGFETPNAMRGQQIKDTEPHDLEISVQLSARTARITATLDERPLYEWSGPATSLSVSKKNWQGLPQPNLFLGTSSADWVVSAVKVKRLEK